MKSIAPMQAERLFSPFLDTVDGTLCLPATANAAEIRSQTEKSRLRFPLLLDANATLHEQINATTHTPASCRFGPYCDNILGMNWRLPSGRIARIGERVVKSTTGYDWLRFLLHSGRRYGEPVDYVIRLRPDCGFQLNARFSGNPDALRLCVKHLLHSGWMHWWDAVDFLAEGTVPSVRVAVHCPAAEAPIFEGELARIASLSGTALASDSGTQPGGDGLPDVVVKTTPDRALVFAQTIAPQVARCVALCYNGVVHLHLGEHSNLAERAHALMQPHLAELHAIGGDWHSRWLPATPPSHTESQWIETLEQTIHAS
jgi:FAD/FMN-containing dehydrogenase